MDTEGDLQRLPEGRVKLTTNETRLHHVKEEYYEALAEIRECIECLACISTCPVVKVTIGAKGSL